MWDGLRYFPANVISDHLRGTVDTELLLLVWPCFPSPSILNQGCGVGRVVIAGRLGWKSHNVLSDWAYHLLLDENFWPKETPYNPLSYFLRYGIFKSNQNPIPKKEQVLWVIQTSPVTDSFVSCCSRIVNEDLISYLFLLFCLEVFLVFQEVSF